MKPTEKFSPAGVFSPLTAAWLERTFATLTPVQARGWPQVAGGAHTLLAAPTGSGKTLAAFLWGIDTLVRLAPQAPPGVRVLYVSPLKALVYDVERNLRAPLAGIETVAAKRGGPLRPIGVDVRTGDTPQAERRRQGKAPADILVTTPESLFLLLGAKARETLTGVHTVIVDELHALAPGKRGAHLALSLERLEALTDRPPQRIGLSATVRPLERAARFLAGERPVELVDAAEPPHLDLRVIVPVPDMSRPPLPEPAGDHPRPAEERGLWPSIYPRLLEEIRAARSSILFVNSRGLCERLARRLNELAGEPLVLAHHGSLSHARRAEIEEGLKSGRVRAIVATSSLELGVDMGAVERVLLVESPGSVARGLQRVGRAGHQVDAVSIGRIYPKFRGDLLECALVSRRMLAGEIESLDIPERPLDVLAQQLVALCCDHERSPAELLALVRRAWPYRGLSRELLERVLDMLSGRYPSTELAELRPLLTWDRARDRLAPRRGTPMLSRLNAGTIPDRGTYGVHLAPDGPRIGELDEEMVYETRTGQVLTLGASSWRVEEIGRDRVLVTPAPGEPGRLPFWHGDSPGRPLELGRALGEMLCRLDRLSREKTRQWLLAHTPLDELAAANLADYLAEQKAATGTLPTDRSIILERFRDELGDWRICLLTPFGARLHAPWAMALQRTLERAAGSEVQLLYTDDGIALRLADGDRLPDFGQLFPDPDEVRELITEQLPDSALFAALFRENAARSLLMPRHNGRERRPLWAQRLKSQQLLAAVRRFPDFPVVMETYRQCLADRFDLAGLEAILHQVRDGAIRVVEAETAFASPFARSLVFSYVAAYIYEQDAPLAERKAQALTLDRRLLGELLGQEELRSLIDPQVLAELEAELQQLPEERRARDPDGLHDLLRRLGDLSMEELEQRCLDDHAPWLRALERQQRAIPLRIAGQERWLAAEEVGLYRDALDIPPPAGLPDTFLAPVDDAFPRLLHRYARVHGPFLTEQPARRYGLPSSQLEPALRLLEGEGRLTRGDMRPGGSSSEWCDPEVLRSLKRRTLARLRRQAAPVGAAAYGRFLPAWHGLSLLHSLSLRERVGVRGYENEGVNSFDPLTPTPPLGPRPGHPDRAFGGLRRDVKSRRSPLTPEGEGLPRPPSLREAVDRLTGLALPWSDLVGRILPDRIPDFRIEALDLLCAGGEIVWVGRGALGARDGRVALYPRERLAALLDTPTDPQPDGPLQQAILDHLERHGACFLLELEQIAGDAPRADFEAALWELVWAGRITNDTFAPLRARLQGPGRRRQGLAGGRWWRLDAALSTPRPDTERLLARAWMLLERYGVVSREAASAEELAGGFGPLYGLLKELESAGRVRRGWFVEGLSGAQFAHPVALERLRAARGEADGGGTGEAPPLWLAATDPANPYGALLPWPPGHDPEAQPKRVAGALVLLADGVPLLYLSANGRRLLSFEPSSGYGEEGIGHGLAQLARMRRSRTLRIEQVDGTAAAQSRLRSALEAVGFVADYRGLVLERQFT